MKKMIIALLCIASMHCFGMNPKLASRLKSQKKLVRILRKQLVSEKDKSGWFKLLVEQQRHQADLLWHLVETQRRQAEATELLAIVQTMSMQHDTWYGHKQFIPQAIEFQKAYRDFIKENNNRS